MTLGSSNRSRKKMDAGGSGESDQEDLVPD